MDISENHSIHGSECQLEARYSFNLCLLQLLRKFRNSEIKSLCYPSPRFHNGAVILGAFKNDAIGLVGRGVTKISDKKLHWGRGYMKIVASPPKKIYFSLGFGQRGSSGALVSIPVVVSFQALAWVTVTSLFCPSSKDDDPEYICAYCPKKCTTKAFLKVHLKATQYHSYDVVDEDESEAKNVDQMEDAPVIPDRPCLIPCTKIFLTPFMKERFSRE